MTCTHEILHLMYFIYIYLKLYIYYIILHCICLFLQFGRCQTVKLRDNCITVVGGMRIIIHVQQWLVNLRCVLAVDCAESETKSKVVQKNTR